MADATPIVAIIGRANVGKSSLFNRLIGARQAIIDDAPGTTRDANYGLVEWGKHQFWLVDTAGFKKAENELEISIREQIDQVAHTADVIIVAVDAGVMITTEDREAARMALKTTKPVVLALSKVDTTNTTGLADKFERLGIKPIVSVSAIHGRGTGDLLDAVTAHLKPTIDRQLSNTDSVKLALLGRPNVGKSSLLNSLAGKQQALVSDIAGTTRDVNNINVVYHGSKVQISDTAGLRRRGKVEPGVEKFSSLRTLSAIAESDICLLLIDATEASVAQDQHIAGLVEESGKGLILIVNKWDAVEKDERTQARLLRKLQADFAFVPWAPVVFTSAVTGLHVTNIFKLALEIRERRRTKIATGPLNKTMEAMIGKHPPAGLKNRQPKLNYATQTGTEPPVFTLFGSHVEFLHFSYRRYLENGLREKYDFTGTPIRLEYKDKRKVKT